MVANPICLGWENKQPLLTKCRSYNQHLLLSASTPLIIVTAQVSTGPPLVAWLVYFRQSESMSELQKSLSQGYLAIHISAWSSIPDCPSFWKEIVYWWITPTFTKMSLITEQPTGASSSSSYPGQTPCSSVRLCLMLVHTGTVWYDMQSAVVKRLAKPLCGLPRPSTLKLNSADILNITSLRLHVYEEYR